MAEPPLREIVDALRDRIHAELDAQSHALTARYEAAVADARREAAEAAEAEAEKRWAARVEAVRVEWGARLQSEVAAARDEAEARLVAESMRARVEAEQAAAESAGRARSEMEQALASERQRAETDLQAERRRAEEHLEQALAAIAAERQQLETMDTRRTSEGPDPGAVLEGVRALEDARSLSEILAALVRASAAPGPRVALFVVNGPHLDEWSVTGVQPLSDGGLDLESAGAGVLGAAARTGAPVSSADGDPTRAVPLFARAASPAHATAVPLMLGGQPVAVLYADDGNHGGEVASEAWMPTVELLGRHAAACLAHLIAIRALQLVQGVAPREQHETARPGDDQSARRYAKLLVSEIKLYNENAVRTGREKGDLMHRLSGEIDRARRLYEERVSPSVTARAAYFHDELVQTLAGGDPALLG